MVCRAVASNGSPQLGRINAPEHEPVELWEKPVNVDRPDVWPPYFYNGSLSLYRTNNFFGADFGRHPFDMGHVHPGVVTTVSAKRMQWDFGLNVSGTNHRNVNPLWPHFCP